jgi:hypothetical protein
MAQQNITIGAANAKAGDTLFTAFTKAEDNFTELYDSDAALDTRLKVVEGDTPAAVAGGVFVSDGAGGGEFIRVQGWEQYEDTNSTVGTPTMTIASGVRTLWVCDGGTTSISKLPSDALAPLWNTATNTVEPIATFDTYSLRISYKVENYAGTAPYIQFELDIGGAQGVIAQQSISLIKGGSEQSILKQLEVFAGSTFLANGGKIYITYVGTGSCDVFDTGIFIRRESKNYV